MLLPLFAWNQVTDDFSDGNFTVNPTWTGTDAHYIVNNSQELQLSNSIAGTSCLVTPHLLSSLDNKQWEIFVRQTFAPSSGNFGRVYLTASSADLTTNPDGFYLQFGEAGSTDAVRLFKSVAGISTPVCASPDGQIAASFAVRIKVIRDHTGLWKLYVDATGGTNFGGPYTGTDTSSLPGTYFGMLQTYTVSNATKFYYDDIYVGDEITDTQAPDLLSAIPITNTQVDLLFSEPVGGTSMLQITNYNFNPALPVSAVVLDGTNAALLHLTLGTGLSNGQNYQVTVSTIEDASGNTASGLSTDFTWLVGETAVKGDLTISEVMTDPSPVVGLPELEFVEIYNKSSKYINLAGWKLGDQSGDGTISSGFIAPGQYRILCATASTPEFPGSYGVSSFPSYNNSGDDVVLKNSSGVVIDKISYTDSWYQDAVKKAGGYTLELINPDDPCSDASNWIASNSSTGGTPGTQNSVYDITPDTQIPYLASLIALSPNYLEVNFSEEMDSVNLVNAVLSTNPNLTVQTIYVASTFSNQAIITFNENLTSSQYYQLSYGPVSDCWLNAATVTGHFALADIPQTGDLVINEILFDPVTGGSDFVELYNRSSKVINLNDLSITKYNGNIIQLTQNYLLNPNSYIVLTPDSNYQKKTFPEAVPGKFYNTTLPALNNDSSTFILLYNNLLIDKVSYQKGWHLPLIDDPENKTLERINPDGPSSSASNWHTAAETVGFGTPGKVNSQYLAGSVSSSFGTTEPIFSPDNDGFQDVLLFQYRFDEAMIAALKIFDNQGREVHTLFSNELLATEGSFTWDGVMTNNQKAPIGIYIAALEAFSLDKGKTIIKRVSFTLAGKLD
ncbi:lamin tail domain-containing protein [Fluviicola sp.]|uniref:lamin tail domain-containing protein n=1 Tax=Fluviicola sp. TaxID=1917219 RepID=UPI00281F2BFB|nr:lamin tail domain-containing protein [Fluviicola sp.]MDR0801405.1 lamin tail domain-containing protein [Fluviicola sp.]